MADNRLPLSLTLSACQLAEHEPARQVLEMLREIGCQFLFGKAPDPNPERRIRQGSIIAPIGFTHVRLARSLESRAVGQKLGVGNLGFIAGQRTAMIFQMPDRSKDLDDIATGLVELAKLVVTRLKPTYAWIDESGENEPQKRVATARGVKLLFWANFFGSKLVKQVGETFLRQCPARVELLPGGGAVVVCGDSFASWLARPDSAPARYLARKFPGIKPYRSTGVGG